MLKKLLLVLAFVVPGFAQTHQFCASDSNCALTGNNTHAGTETFSADAAFISVNGKARIFVDQYASWSAALAACPSAGCILDATSPNVPRAMGAFDVGTKQVKVEFGPFSNFTAVQITLRAGIWLQGISGATNATVITSVGTNAQQLLTTPQTTGIQVFNFKVDGIRFIALSGNTSQEGLLSDVSGCTNCNLNYGAFSNLWFINFVGTSVHLKGRTADALAANQTLYFNNVVAQRVSGSNPALKIEGYAGQIQFDSCEFDGASIGDGTNIYIGTGGGASTQQPNTIYFTNLTSQNGSQAFNVDGGNDIDIRYHAENSNGGILVSNTGSAGAATNQLIHIHDSWFNTNVGVNGGNGFLVSITDTSNPNVIFENNVIAGAPDNVIKGPNTNCCNIYARNNRYIVSPSGAAPTLNFTQAMAPAATLDIKDLNHILLTTSVTNITTLKGSHLPGETVTFLANGGTIQFATGGNISLGSNTSPLICTSGDSVTFTRMDLGSTWQLSAASPGCMNAFKVNTTTVTDKTGTGKVALDTNPVLTTATLTGLTNGTGLQFFNTSTTCTTGAAVGATCTTGAITLPVGYSDTNYRVNCTGQTATNVPIVQTYAKSNTTFTITIAALTAAAATFTSYDCSVGHNGA